MSSCRPASRCLKFDSFTQPKRGLLLPPTQLEANRLQVAANGGAVAPHHADAPTVGGCAPAVWGRRYTRAFI